MKSPIALFALAGVACAASGQVVISEVWENPPGDGDVFDPSLEYIELYGEPGMDLTGYAVALVKGGADVNGDNIPESRPEIDEAFGLDGLSLGSNGFLVIYNDTGGFSDIPFYSPAATTQVGFTQAHINFLDTAGKLANDGSSSYVLVRSRNHHAIVGGMSQYGPAYDFHKDINPDIDFDGKFDFGIELPAIGSFVPSELEPLQAIDDVAWSNLGGKEYVVSSEQEISDTPGFNPDGVSRIAFYGENPGLGMRLNSDMEIVPTRMADEEWIYGEQGPGDGDLTYVVADSGAPTDPSGDGFADIDITGFAMTPGDFNDSASAGITQFRFVRGDFNFDGVADADDGTMISGSVGEHLDVLVGCVDEEGMPVIIDDVQVMCPFYQGRAANGLLAMMNMDKSDGAGGANAATVTQADLDAWNAEFGVGGCNLADLAEPFGILDLGDIGAFVGGFTGGDPIADLAAPFGIFDLNDIGAFVSNFTAGCP